MAHHVRSFWFYDLLSCTNCAGGSALERYGEKFKCSLCGASYSASDRNFIGVRGDPDLAPLAAEMSKYYLRAESNFVVSSSFLSRCKQWASSRGDETEARLALASRELGGKAMRILVVGSNALGAGTEGFLRKCASSGSTYVGMDIADSPTVDIIGDAHTIPFLDESFDFVICQAVLEHVLFPNKVVGEIYRVLKQGGIFYSEIPFLQQVHEPPFDFTRYTMLGHLILLKEFYIVEFNKNKGHLYVLAWWVKYGIQFCCNKFVSSLISFPFFLVAKYLDPLIKIDSMFSVSGTYVIAKKSKPQSILERLGYFDAKKI